MLKSPTDQIANLCGVHHFLGTHLCMNSPVDPVSLQLVQQNLNSPQDEVKNMSADCEEGETTVQAVFQFCASSVLEDLQQRVVRPKTDQQKIEHQAELTENRIGDLEDRVTVVEEKHEGTYKYTSRLNTQV